MKIKNRLKRVMALGLSCAILLGNVLETSAASVESSEVGTEEAVESTESQIPEDKSSDEQIDSNVEEDKEETSDSASTIESDSESFSEIAEQTIDLIDTTAFYLNKNYVTPSAIETADTAGFIDLYLFDYSANDYAQQIIGGDYNGSGVTQGYADTSLSNGMIQFINGNSGNLLFSTDSSYNQTYRTNVTKANHLFTYDSTTGYYEYDSAKNFATIDTTTGDFTVYNVAGSNRNPQYQTGTAAYGQFFPYSQLNTSSYITNYSYQASGTATADSVAVYNISNQNNGFGMSVGFNFIQPENGRVNDEDMIFEFAGDDDVFVYIDGKLVLDMGGSHERCTGEINFSTGVVTITNNDGSVLTSSLKEALGLEGDTLSDYSTHSFQMYYDDRGNLSGCAIKFNIPTTQTDTVSITKKVETADDTVSVDENTQYQFKMYAGSDSNQLQLVCDTTYQIYENGLDTGETGTVSSDGVITLKKNETAVLELARGSYYQIEEVDPGTNVTVSMNKTICETESEQGEYTSEVLNSIETPEVIVTNYYNTNSDQVESNLSKSVTVDSEEDRTYQISLAATEKSTTTTTIVKKEPIDVIFVFDTSKSMEFPSDLEALSDTKKISQLDTSKVYYYIENTTSATVYKVFYKSKNWCYVDASKSDDDAVKITNSSSVINKKETYQLYISASNGTDTRLEELKTAANSILSSLEDASEDSIVGLVTFNTDTATVDPYALKDKATIGQNIENYLANSLTTASGTNPNAALKAAAKMLENDTIQNSGHKKYIILLTDGCQNKDSVENTVATANSIKEGGTTILTVGVDLDINTAMTTAKTMLLNVASDTSEDGKYAYETSSQDLSSVFSSIMQNVFTSTSETTYCVATVKDYIDERFELVTKTIDGDEVSYTALKENDNVTASYVDETTGKEVSIIGTVKYDKTEKLYYIEWPQSVLSGWKVNFLVRAKEDFLGGNMVPTNGEKSGVYQEDSEEPSEKFEMPTANVTLLDFDVEDTTKTYFLGETITVLDLLEQLNQKVTSDQMKLTETEAEQLLENARNGKTYTKEYTYGDSSFGTLEYTLTCINGDGALKDHEATKAGKTDATEVEGYVLTVSYTPYQITERNEILSKVSGQSYKAAVGSEQIDALKKTGNCSVYVVAGTVTVSKKIKKSDINFANGDPIFTFQITDGNRTYTRTVRFSQSSVSGLEVDEDGYITLSTTFQNLKKGTYTASELATIRYQTSDVDYSKADTTCDIKLTQNASDTTAYTAQIAVGQNSLTDSTTKLTARTAEISYTNQKVNGDNFSHTDEVVNHFSIDEDGNIVITQLKDQNNE